jgi:hypothetical protein
MLIQMNLSEEEMLPTVFGNLSMPTVSECFAEEFATLQTPSKCFTGGYLSAKILKIRVICVLPQFVAQ